MSRDAVDDLRDDFRQAQRDISNLEAALRELRDEVDTMSGLLTDARDTIYELRCDLQELREER